MAKYSEMSTYEKRLLSFDETFPVNEIQITPHQFAEAGFFSVKMNDFVRCFYCGVGLRGWESNDDVWKQHAKFAEKCNFLIRNKGIEFGKNSTTNSSTAHTDSVSELVNSNNAIHYNERRSNAGEQIRKILTNDEVYLHVTARMQLPKVLKVINYGQSKNLGYNSKHVRMALENQFKTYGNDFENVTDLTKAAIACANEDIYFNNPQ